MKPVPSFLLAFAGLAMLAGVLPSAAQERLPRPTGKVAPRLEAVAETKLLMEGLAHANFRGMEKLLRQRPGDVQTWTFLRGQALLVAETGNLLLLRPPHNQGQSLWMERATVLRAQAVKLARAAARADYATCKAGLRELATACNRCPRTISASATCPFPITATSAGMMNFGWPHANGSTP